MNKAKTSRTHITFGNPYVNFLYFLFVLICLAIASMAIIGAPTELIMILSGLAGLIIGHNIFYMIFVWANFKETDATV